MKILRIALGLASPIVLPLLVVLIQQQWTIFRYPEINTVITIGIPVGFFLVGCITGVLIRAWWSLAYILSLGLVWTGSTLLQEEYPGSESHAIAIMLFIVIVPLAMLGATIGVLISNRLERGSPRSPGH